MGDHSKTFHKNVNFSKNMFIDGLDLHNDKVYIRLNGWSLQNISQNVNFSKNMFIDGLDLHNDKV